MTLIDKIRNETKTIHQDLDRLLVPCIENIESKEDYAALLIQFYGFFKPVYDAIDACIDTQYLSDYNERRKPEWIINDLEALSINYNIYLCKQLPAVHDNASAFGALYVLEGSTLGGMIIRKMISDKLQITEGLSFFNGYGKHTRQRWSAFVESLNSLEINDTAQDTVIHTAVNTFQLLKDWLQPVHTHVKAINFPQ